MTITEGFTYFREQLYIFNTIVFFQLDSLPSTPNISSISSTIGVYDALSDSTKSLIKIFYGEVTLKVDDLSQHMEGFVRSIRDVIKDLKTYDDDAHMSADFYM